MCKVVTKLKTLLIAVLFFFGVSAFAQTPIKVACVGTSITYGMTMANPGQNSYPSQLQEYLGNKYEVKNFGVSGTTLLQKGGDPYRNKPQYNQSLAYNPDIVVLEFGANDSKIANQAYWPEFEADYLSLIESYRNLPSNPRIILTTPTRCYLTDPNDISDNIMRTKFVPIIEKIGYEKNIGIVNLYDLWDITWSDMLMPDKLHPSPIGAGRMADKVYSYIAASSGTPDNNVNFSLSHAETFNYHGYKGYKYLDNGVEYRLVFPYKHADGNPWIWRTCLFGEAPQTELDLLERGFTVAYCDVEDLYGSPSAIDRCNRFYDLAVDAGLNSKVVLEGMDYGALTAYNWAASNVEKVAAIYADAPVMDFKTWPMGHGGKRSDKDTEALLKAYGFTSEQEAMEWKKNPIDHADIFGRANLPMIHVVGESDIIVPVSTNTDVFAERLKKYDYKLNVVRKTGAGHLPYSEAYPYHNIVRYILQSTEQGENMCAHPICGNEYRTGAGWTVGDWHKISEEINSVVKDRNLDILFIGNSITQGLGGNRRRLVNYKPGLSVANRILSGMDWESAGISGDRTQHVLWRVQQGAYESGNPKTIAITIGINNLLDGGDIPREVAEGIHTIAMECRKRFPKSNIISLGLFPSGFNPTDAIRIKYNEVHKFLSEYEWNGVRYIDPTSWFVNSNGTIRTDCYGGDYIHFTDKGYEVWCNKLKDIINNPPLSGSISLSNTDGGRNPKLRIKASGGYWLPKGWMAVGYIKSWDGTSKLSAEDIARNFEYIGTVTNGNIVTLGSNGILKLATFNWENVEGLRNSPLVALIGDETSIKDAGSLGVIKFNVSGTELKWENADKKSINISADLNGNYIVPALGSIIEEAGTKYLKLAQFAYPTGIETEEYSNIKISARNGMIQISGMEMESIVTITDMSGKIYKTITANEPSVEVDAPQKGIYIVSLQEGGNKQIYLSNKINIH